MTGMMSVPPRANLGRDSSPAIRLSGRTMGFEESFPSQPAGCAGNIISGDLCVRGLRQVRWRGHVMQSNLFVICMGTQKKV